MVHEVIDDEVLSQFIAIAPAPHAIAQGPVELRARGEIIASVEAVSEQRLVDHDTSA